LTRLLSLALLHPAATGGVALLAPHNRASPIPRSCRYHPACLQQVDRVRDAAAVRFRVCVGEAARDLQRVRCQAVSWCFSAGVACFGYFSSSAAVVCPGLAGVCCFAMLRVSPVVQRKHRLGCRPDSLVSLGVFQARRGEAVCALRRHEQPHVAVARVERRQLCGHPVARCASKTPPQSLVVGLLGRAVLCCAPGFGLMTR
jgi:hypothetical protein